MSMKSGWVRYGAEPHVGYLSYPERAVAPLPAILVLHEAWGVDAHIENVTRRFGGAGYAAFAPDLFAKGGERIPALTHDRLAELQAFMNALPSTVWFDAKVREAELAKLQEAERTRISESFTAMTSNVMNQAAHVPALLAATRYLREELPLTRGQKIGSVGFCFGGGLSALLAGNDPDLAAAIVFYGNAPPADLIPSIRCPMRGFYGSLDTRLTGQLPAFESGMKAAGKSFEPVVYEGVQHAFFNDSRPSYDVRASRDSWVKSVVFFQDHLS